MNWQFTPFSLPILLALAVSVVLFGYIVTRYRDGRRDPIVVLYLWITVAAIVWIGFASLKLLHTDPASKLLFYRFLHVGAAALPPLTFLFAITFTDRLRWLRIEAVGAVFLVPAVFTTLILVHPGEVIIAGTTIVRNDIVVLRAANGPGFTLFLSYSALLAVASLVIIFAELRQVGRAYVPQAGLLALAVSTPIVFAVLTAAGIPPFADDRVNLVPTAGAVSVASFGLLLYRYRLVDLPPLAHATAMKYSPDALIVLDRDGRIIHTNDHAARLLDATSGGLDAVRADSPMPLDPETLSNELIETTASTGERGHHRVLTEPLVRGERRIGWVVVLRDETDQQRQQQRLQQKNEQMERFAATITHDLRNPLGVARGYLQLVRDEVEREELDRVETALARMEEIIDELLTLARSGSPIDDLEPVQLDAVLASAWSSVTTETAELSVADTQSILADPTMVQHVFENLFRNAIEHAGDTVTVTVGSLDGGIYVEDSGTGIPVDERENVFEVGYTTMSGGTGFGLGIVEQIVDAHGWTILVTEADGGGARFEITGIESAD